MSETTFLNAIIFRSRAGNLLALEKSLGNIVKKKKKKKKKRTLKNTPMKTVCTSSVNQLLKALIP